jgi:hypothetical protein
MHMIHSKTAMSTQEIADKLVGFCREGKFEAAQKELFADDAVSREPKESSFPKETKGLPAIIEKGRQFSATIEKVHSISVSEPICTPDVFACTMTMDVTMKGQGRSTMSELCVYDVSNGKIVSEHFHV